MKEVDEEVFLLRIRAISIRLEPIPSLRRLSLAISSISPNTKREQAMARVRAESEAHVRFFPPPTVRVL